MSPQRMSILPSLLTSAMATPSERKCLSTTVFFQEMGVGCLLSSALQTPGHSNLINEIESAAQPRKENVRIQYRLVIITPCAKIACLVSDPPSRSQTPVWERGGVGHDDGD